MMANPILKWAPIVGTALGACAALVTAASWYARVAAGDGAAEELGVPETSLAQIPAWAGLGACVVALGTLVLVVVRPASDLRAAVAVVPAAIVGFVTGFRGPVLLLPVVGAVLVLVVERQIRATIPEGDRRGVVPGSGDPFPTGPVDVEDAAAARLYPYPRPLPEPAKSKHVAAVGAWQKRFVPWLGLGFAGVIILFLSVSRGRFADPGDPLIYWDPEPVVGAVMYGCGLALIGIGAAGGNRAVLARFRHARLLAAYGVPLDVRGHPRQPKDLDKSLDHRESPP